MARKEAPIIKTSTVLYTCAGVCLASVCFGIDNPIAKVIGLLGMLFYTGCILGAALANKDEKGGE